MSGWLRRHRRLVALGAAVVLLGMLILSGGERLLRSREDETWARVQREGVLRVGMDASFPPFEVEEGGTFRGYDVELAQEIGRRLGLRVAFVNVHFDGLYDALLARRCDVLISALPYEAERTRDVAYTGGYFNSGQVLVTRRDETGIQSASDLADRRVAVEMGSQAHQEARLLRDRQRIALTIVTGRSSEEAFDLLEAGKADAVLADAITARGALRSRQELAIRGTPLTNEPFVIATRRDSPQLYAAVNGVLIALREEGWLESLVERLL